MHNILYAVLVTLQKGQALRVLQDDVVRRNKAVCSY